MDIALRARKDMPALALALERMNVRDPALVVALASAARRLTLAGTYEQVAPGLRRWQGALALVERMHLSAAWPSARLAPLLKSLAADGAGQRAPSRREPSRRGCVSSCSRSWSKGAQSKANVSSLNACWVCPLSVKKRSRGKDFVTLLARAP